MTAKSDAPPKDYLVVPVFYGTDRATSGGTDPTRFYGSERADERRALQLGVCEVSIPKDHQMGELEAPHWWKLEFRENPERHVTLLSVLPLAQGDFFTRLKAYVANASRDEAFIFIHGYNVKFADAARRTAQIAYDLGFPGAPILFSWPSQGEMEDYAVDETNVEWAVPHLQQFVADIAAHSGAREIHLIAHSMGNRALTKVLSQLRSNRSVGETPRFKEVILAAPDIDAEIFRRDVLPAIRPTAGRITLYASDFDRALKASKRVHGYARAGDGGAAILVASGIDTVDATEVDTGLMGHSYYADNCSIIGDMFLLLNRGLPPDQRDLQPKLLSGGRYWAVKPVSAEAERCQPPVVR